jgi:hypothetical protein
MSGINFQNFLVGFLSFLTVSLLLVDNCQVEQCRRVWLLIDRHLEVVDSLVHIFAELIQQHTHVEIRFEVFGVDCKRALVQLATLLEGLVCGRGLLKFNALG